MKIEAMKVVAISYEVEVEGEVVDRATEEKPLDYIQGTKMIIPRLEAELEGKEGMKHIDEYADASTERGKKLRKAIAKKMGFDTLEFQTLDGVIEAIGIDRCKLCTYCWTGEE